MSIQKSVGSFNQFKADSGLSGSEALDGYTSILSANRERIAADLGIAVTALHRKQLETDFGLGDIEENEDIER